MSSPFNIVIVGAGPAGIRAAQALVVAGLSPVMIDENARFGGQIYRQPPAGAGFMRTARALYGFESHKATALHATMTALLPHVDYRPNTLVWGLNPGRLDTLYDGRAQSVPFSHLILASGATDRMLPVPGWTLPGVYTLGGAQIALKAQGCAIGQRVIFAGTGPLLYLVAWQYVKVGAHVVAVLDCSSLSQQIDALPNLARLPGTLAKGMYYVGRLRARGIRIERGIVLEQIEGRRGVAGIRWRRANQPDADASQTIACDAVGLGFGLRPETQLADLAGCRFRYDDLQRGWLPEIDPAGRSSVAGVYLAGDGAHIAGADAAEWGGRRAALALLEDIGVPARAPLHASPGRVRTADARPTMDRARSLDEPVLQSCRLDAAALERRLNRVMRFRTGIEHAFRPVVPIPSRWPDDTIICRCEEVDAGTLRRSVRAGDASEINRLKALTRVGMGRCQGRMCGEAASLLLCAETGLAPVCIGRLRAQAPVKPVPLSLALVSDPATEVAEDERDE
jgi:NADPH-dependent 2,4-dienoyl-CoA reductase/sulfur reductase-like enzyme